MAINSKYHKSSINILSTDDLPEIRQILGYKWRDDLARTLTGITPRQITHSFNLKSKDARMNRKIWNKISVILRKKGAIQLSEKARNYALSCQPLYNLIQK